jgi:cyanophycin synthetase
VDVPTLRGCDLDPAGLRVFLQELAEAIPILTESAWLASPDLLLGCENATIGFALAICEVVIRDFCVEPRLGELLAAGDGKASLFVPCDEPEMGNAALRLAVGIANAAPEFEVPQPGRFRQLVFAAYRDVRRLAKHAGLDQSTLAVARGAVARGIPVSRINSPGRFIQLGQGVHRRRMIETAPETLSLVATQIASDKFITGSLLAQSGIPTPFTHAIASVEEGLKVAEKLGFPLVVKPRAAGKGKGVTVDIRSEEQLRRALEEAETWRKGMVIERFVTGDDHRMLVVGGHLVAVARRVPAHVTGDGSSSVRQLIDQANHDPRRGITAFERLLEPIEIDDEALEWLAKAGLGLDSVPAAETPVRLRGAANVSRGGTADDLTQIVHPDNRAVVERAAKLVGLDVTGIDFLSPDISRSWREVPSAILEVNALPGLRPHFISNPDRDVIGPIIELMFPGDAEGRVPTIGVTGSLGKTSTTMMAAAILANAGLKVAAATTQSAWIDGQPVRQGDLAGGGIAQRLLQDPMVEAGVFELARGGLVKRGMTLDRLDVGVVLGVLDDHIGLDGAETREDLARIKRLVIENARKLAVLNADDPLCLAMRDHAGTSRIALVSARADNPEILKHRRSGGLAAWIDEIDQLVLFETKKEIGRIALLDLPDCWNGAFRPAALNALFAACACHGLGIEFAVIAEALTRFRSDARTNPGRNNYFEGLPYRLLISHADGPEAIHELANLAGAIAGEGRKRLLLTSVGDRPDSFIENIARNAAGAFSEYYCSDWGDLRGRAPGAVPELLAAALRNEGVAEDRIHVILPSDDAVRAAYRDLGPEDLLVDVFGGHFGDRRWQALRGLTLSGDTLVPA